MGTSCHRAIARRSVLAAGLGVGVGGLSLITLTDRASGATAELNMQLGWIGGGNQLGEACAHQLGYFKDAGLDFHIRAGGPNNDGIAIVASGRYQVGQVSSSPSLMLAASQDIPIRCFAVSAQKHPYAFFSLPKKPIRTPEDLIGKRVGIQATGVILLRALLAKNKIPFDKVHVVIIGSDMTPLLTGQVDTLTGWLTNTTALKVLGPGVVSLRLWDAGVHLYANPYYATADTLSQKADMIERFLGAAAKGWGWADKNRDEAIKLLIKEFPNLNAHDERIAADVMLSYCFDENTKQHGYGTMDPAVWQDQIDTWASLGQFQKHAPKLDEVMTMAILKATENSRPRLG